MPFKNNSQLPKGAHVLPPAAKTLWRKAFNGAFEGTCKGDDSCAASVAWSVVKKQFTKKDGKWVAKHMTDVKKLVTHFEWDMSGRFPDVPMRGNIDLAELTKDDPNPTYVTLPIAQIGKSTEDGFLYTEEFVKFMERSIMSAAQTAHMGHIPKEDRETLFPVPDAFWVGAVLEGDKLWAKAYVADPKVANYARQLKAANGTLATSIYGTYDTDAMQMVKGGKWSVKPEGFSLEHIDFAPPQRAALRVDGQRMQITNHMKGTKMNKQQFIAQLQPSDLPPALREEVEKPHKELIAQLKDEVASTKEALAQFASKFDEMSSEIFNGRVSETIRSTVKTNDESLFDYVKTKALAQLKKDSSVEEIKAAVDGVVESETYTKLATAVLAQLSGGKPFTSVNSAGNEKTSADNVMEKLDDIKAKYNIK